MEFANQLPDEMCVAWFNKLFRGIWNESTLEEIIFSDEEIKTSYYKSLYDKNTEPGAEKSKLVSLAVFLGDSLWDIFSNNHSVYFVDGNVEIDIGSFRGSGLFISDFIKGENSTLQFSYMDFYMGHFNEKNKAGKSYEYIFQQLEKNGLDWYYAYPKLGVVDFSNPAVDKPEDYNPNNSLKDEIEKQNFMKLIDKINEETFDRIQNNPVPSTIRAYIKVFNKFPGGWIEN